MSQYPFDVRNHIWMAQIADGMARQCLELDDSPRPRSDAPDFRRIGFRHRQKARELLNE